MNNSPLNTSKFSVRMFYMQYSKIYKHSRRMYTKLLRMTAPGEQGWGAEGDFHFYFIDLAIIWIAL